MIRKRVPATVRFWAKVNRTDGCWLWTAKISITGYGRFSNENHREVAAHRFAYIDTYGPVGDGLLVCHHCDVRHCVRPDHLFVGTQKDNIQDAIKKNRFPQMRNLRRGGGRTPILTKDNHQPIRDMYAQGLSHQNIADKFHVSHNTIVRIIQRHPRYPYYQ